MFPFRKPIFAEMGDELQKSDIAVLSYCTMAFVVYSASFRVHEAVESSWPLLFVNGLYSLLTFVKEAMFGILRDTIVF